MSKNFETIGLFPVPIIKIKFKDHHKYNFPEVEKKETIPPGWECSVDTSFPDIDPDDPVVSPTVKKNLMADIKTSIVEVFEELNIPTNIDFQQFWYNIYHDDQGQEKHNHLAWIGAKNLYWCGIYYNKNSSPTAFHRGSGLYETQRFPDYNNTAMSHILSDIFYLPVEDGDIILFPSWINHSVKSEPQHKDKMRMTFSFNIDLLTLNVDGTEILL